jgi:hypothetical protein
LIARGLAGFEPNSALQPWYLLPSEQVFLLSDRWPGGAEASQSYAFARRQDSDDLACFVVTEGASQPAVVVVHGWTPEGYEIVARFDSIWEWLRDVIRDIREWVTLEEG